MGQYPTKVILVPVIILVICSTLVSPLVTVDAQEGVSGDVTFSEINGELTVEINERNARDGSFTGDTEEVTIDIGGTRVTPDSYTPGESDSTYTYTVTPDELSGLDSLDARDGTATTVTVSHQGIQIFSETVNIQFVVLSGSGGFTSDGELRLGTVQGQNFGVADGGSVPLRVDTRDESQNITATYRQSQRTNESFLVIGRDTLSDLGVFRQPQEITTFGREYVRSSARVDIADAAPVTGQRLAGTSRVRFNSTLFEDGESYTITVRTEDDLVSQTVEADERTVQMKSPALSMVSTGRITIQHTDTGTRVVEDQTVELETELVTGNAIGATVEFSDLPDRLRHKNISAVLIQNGSTTDQHNATLVNGNLTLQDAEPPVWPAYETEILIQFEEEGVAPLRATVIIQSGVEANQPTERSDSPLLGLVSNTLFVIFSGSVLVVLIVASLWYATLSYFNPDLGLGESSRSESSSTDGADTPFDLIPINVQVVVGPDQKPAGLAKVTASVENEDWSGSTRTDPDGTARIRLPASASTVTFTAESERFPPSKSRYPSEEIHGGGKITLPIADPIGTVEIETRAGGQPFPNVEVFITPVNQEAEDIVGKRTVVTDRDGRYTVRNLPTGTYEISARPRLDGIEATAPTEEVVIEDDEPVAITLPISISYTLSEAHRERIEELEEQISDLTNKTGRDVAIPRYYGTVLTSMLELVEEIASSPERAVAENLSPPEAITSILDATEVGVEAVDDAMSERRCIDLFQRCETMQDDSVEWEGEATLDAVLEWMSGEEDHYRGVFSDSLAETDDFLQQRWSEVAEMAPARKLHDRISEFTPVDQDSDERLTLTARLYLGVCLLDAIEALFEHDQLRERLDRISY